MTDDQLRIAQEMIRRNPTLIWYTKAYDKLMVESVAEAIFNYGTWQEFHELKENLGTNELAKIFHKLDIMPRNNLYPQVRNYFRLYFGRHAH